MQAKLPDINAALVRHRNAVMIAYDRGDFDKAAISFDAMIALLPEDYRLEINTDKYNKLVSSKHILVCRYCKNEIENKDIMTYRLLLSALDRLITSEKQLLVWDCAKCHMTQPMLGTKRKVEVMEEPSYLGVIPEPPTRYGLHDRTGFEGRFKKWYSIVFRELENKIGDYRKEYASQQEGEGVSEASLIDEEKASEMIE